MLLNLPRIGLAGAFFLILTFQPASAQLSFSPSTIDLSLEAGESTSATLSLHNEGIEPASVRVVRRRAGSDGTGLLFATSGGHFGIVRLDPVTGQAISNAFWPPRGLGAGREGLAFDGTSLYFTPGDLHNSLYKLDPNSGAVMEAMRIPPGMSLDGLAHTGRALFALDGEAAAIHEIDIEEGRIVRSIHPGFGIIAGLSAGGSRGTLFVLANDGSGIREISVDSGEVVNVLPIGGFFVGMAYSNELEILFVFELLGVSTGRLLALDPDTGELLYQLAAPEFGFMGGLAADESLGMAEWAALSDHEVTIPAGGSIELQLVIDTATLVADGYTGEIALIPAAGGEATAILPVSLAVSGAPALATVPTSLEFGDIIAGATIVQELTVHNDGTDVLAVASMVGSEGVTVDVEPFTVPPGRRVFIPVAVTVSEVGAFAGSVELMSDDPTHPAFQVSVSATVVPAPVLVLSEDVVHTTIDAGSLATVTLTASNPGLGGLALEVYGGSAGLLAPGRETPVGYLPTVISGLSNEGSPPLEAVRSWSRDGALHVEMEFAEEVDIDASLVSVLFIDHDQDISTGGPPRFYLPHVLGAEFEVTFNTDFSRVTVFPNMPHHTEGGGMSPLHFDRNRIWYSLPLEHIQNEDGRVDMLGIIGAFHPHIPFPDGQAASVGGPHWFEAVVGGETIAPGESGLITLNFDTSALFDGTYEAAVLVRSNDPTAPYVLVPVSLTVVGTPAIVIEPQSINFGDVFVGGHAEQTLTVHNPGTATLTVSSVQSSSLSVSATPLTLSIPPAESAEVTVLFMPAALGEESATLTFSSDDPEHPEVVVQVAGQGTEAPVAGVSISELHVNLLSGDSAVEVISITNAGGGELEFALAARPEVDPTRSEPSQRARMPQLSAESLAALAAYRGRATGEVAGSFLRQRSGHLPLIIEDPEGDALGKFDVIAVRGRSFDGLLELEIEFADEIDLDWLGGVIGLDVDRDASTGEVPFWALPEQELGVEFEISLFDAWLDVVSVWSQYGDFVGEYPLEADGNKIYIAIPLAAIDSDGSLHLGGLVGSGGIGFQPSDWFPDAGYGVVGGVNWITIEPEVGTVDPQSSTEVQLTFTGEDLEPGTYYATLVVSTNDPQQASIEVPISLTLGAVTTDPEAGQATFALHAAFPNPSSGMVTIQFELADAGLVDLALFDVQGRLVRRVIHGEHAIGSHSILIDTASLASGVYVYRLRAGGQEASRRLLVMNGQ